MEPQQILDSFRREVQAGHLLTMKKVIPCNDFFTAVDKQGNPVGDVQDPKTWSFVLYKRGFCQSRAPKEPFIKKVGSFLQVQMSGKFLAYYPFAEPGLRTTGQLVGFTLASGHFLVRIGKREP